MSLSDEAGNRRGEQVVLNTSSLSSFVITQCFDLLQSYFYRIYIPEAVRREFSMSFHLPTGIIVRTLTVGQRNRANMLGISDGESEAIILAMDMEAPLVMDDGAARKIAKKFGVTVIGSIGIVRVAFIDCVVERGDYDARISAFEQKGRASIGIIAWARSARKP